MDISVDVDATGPLFDARRDVELRGLVDDSTRAVAEAGLRTVLDNLHTSIRHPTGYYESHVRLDNTAQDRVITDGGVVYGPWLEGVGSRNETTRFKGYASFRRATAALEARVNELTRHAVDEHVRRLSE